MPSGASGVSTADLIEDSDVVVTGTVRSASLVDIERELGWDLDPQWEVEFEGTQSPEPSSR